MRDVVTSQAALTALVTTHGIALLVTLLVLLISYPVAYYLANRRGRALHAGAVLHRRALLHQRHRPHLFLDGAARPHGIVNQLLLGSASSTEPLTLLYSKTGVLIGMVYVLLPYMVLTLYAP